MIIGMITVRIDDHLHVLKVDLPIGHEAAIKQRLTVPNGDKAAALKRGDWGAPDLPDAFALYQDQGPHLVLPRGYAAELRAGLERAGYGIAWVDETSSASLPLNRLVSTGPELYAHQEQACRALLRVQQGVLQAPVASGKTVVVLEAWRRSGLRGLILVEKAGLAHQWRERAREHLDIETGMIGEGEWIEKDLTIAMMQTLHRREIGTDWWRRFGFTAADECHHLVAETYSDVVRRVRSRYLIGVTATPLEGEWTQPFLTHTIGPIFHLTSSDDLRKAGLRVAPMIQRVHTGWRWRPENKRDADLVDTKVIYRRILKQLEQGRGNVDRVGLIAKAILEQPLACAQLVVCKSLAYLDHLKTALEVGGYKGEILMLRGAERKQSVEIAARVMEGRCVLLSTVAGEATDIPRLDRLHLVWPQRKPRIITQQVGRILRSHPDKRGSVVFDYVDDEGILANQARERLRVYRQAGYAIEQERAMQGNLT
jgi:superfamily II DNA or RNA helicase